MNEKQQLCRDISGTSGDYFGDFFSMNDWIPDPYNDPLHDQNDHAVKCSYFNTKQEQEEENSQFISNSQGQDTKQTKSQTKCTKSASSQPFFTQVKRSTLNINVDKQKEDRYDQVKKGNKKETKSQNKNVHVLLNNYLKTRIEHQHLNNEEAEIVEEFRQHNGNFKSMWELLGFKQNESGFSEKNSHDRIKLECLSYLSRPDFMRDCLKNKSDLVQKLTRFKYADVTQMQVIDAPVTKWKD